ncbi:MAG TPA: ABC transporter permease subunit [Solirubrobacterales bacterium]|nr:ABC transporter permease subunit [Solirubrobacterales bacterium]
MSDALVIAAHALREAVRRRVLLVVALLTAGFLALYALAAFRIFDSLERVGGDGFVPVDEQALAGGTLLGMAMFVALFLGVVLAVFLTLGAVRGDAERGLLQPLVVRPVGRTTLLIGRLLAGSAVCVPYVITVFLAAALITNAAGDFTPGSLLVPAAGLGLGVMTVVAISLLGSTLLGTTANGIAIFMVFATGLAAGLLGQIGEALKVDSLTTASSIISWSVPFEALYQNGLHALTSDIEGAAGVIVQLGPFGGASNVGAAIWPWAVAWSAGMVALAALAFRRRDL